jgi:hypothetical protein
MSLLAFANMVDFVARGEDGEITGLGIAKATRAQMAAVKQIVVETYVEGKGESARAVKRIKLVLYDKNQSLLNFARLMGYVADAPDKTVQTLEERLRWMTPEERKEDARQLWERAQEVLRRTEEREAARRAASEAEFEEVKNDTERAPFRKRRR